jgi:nucleotide-binding universal stress UspA family protein
VRILLAVDQSDGSAKATEAVIEQFVPAHTQVTVLHADDWPRGMPVEMSFAEGSAAARNILALHKLRRRNAAALLASTTDRLREAGFTTAASLRDGDPRQAIIECARECRADLIVLGSNGRRGLDRMLGSVSDSVARHAPCSVEIVRTSTEPPAEGRPLAASDGSRRQSAAGRGL